MTKLKETLNSKRFQALVMAVLCAVGAFSSGAIEAGEMWAQIRIDLLAYVASIVLVQAPVDAMNAFMGGPTTVVNDNVEI